MEAPTVQTTPERPKGWDLVPSNEALIRQVKSGAAWLYWIAGLSGVNALLTHFEAPIRFSLGLGITELVYVVGLQLGPIGAVLGGIVDFVFLACIAALGVAGVRLQGWAIVAGIVILAADTALLVVLTGTELILGIVFHVVAILYLGVGYKALRQYRKRQREGNA